ncbi:trans-aconitate 2-methyltransferase [Starkeya koreensis]|uniref:Trans-aconitate 2-methyltransferase n=1 Tax=Ancylobacter koreensis TaxID=266121 RepID=A0ABT0DNB0_9HYPH|nr:trans-aconitate 2-methyltransferase [Ancylobacter koreensis]MCK0208684.1 trans-aconitate 2-methyltransferase [Ancylobacter koreensis]
MTANDWSAAQYLKFEAERTRPSADLLARVPLVAPRTAIDIGCGPGNSTELVAARYPGTAVEGLDSSPDMLEKARKRLPGLTFHLGDIATWQPARAYDLVFANAVLQWLGDHERLLPHLTEALAPGGCLAVQMPDNHHEPSHVAMREIADAGPWAEKLRGAKDSKADLGSFDDYYRWLRAAGCTVDIWRTTYVHPMEGASAIAEWFKSTGLKPYLDRLDDGERKAFVDSYIERIDASYEHHEGGTLLLRFPRLFIVARRPG